MERRSAKRAAPRRKYTVDAFEGIEELQDVHSDGEARDQPADEEDVSVADFENGTDASAEEDEMSGIDENVDEAASNEASDAGERLLDEAISVAEDNEGEASTQAQLNGLTNLTPSKSRRRIRPKKAGGLVTYTRGVREAIVKNSSRHVRRVHYFGPVSDFSPVDSASVKWALEPTLPSRNADKQGFGGMHRSFLVEDSATMIDGSHIQRLGSAVHDDSNSRQLLASISMDEAQPYQSEGLNGSCSFLMGPFKQQQLFSLAVGGHVPLDDVWRTSHRSGSSTVNQTAMKRRCGFVLNMGARVNCLEWAPNQDGMSQYLAVSVLPERKASHPPFAAPHAPAITPTSSYKSNIQIWRFEAEHGGFTCTHAAPQLGVVYCTEWGDAKALKWCPMVGEDNGQSSGVSMGMLAGIWSDGTVRVLDVVQPAESNATRYLRVQRAVFEARPPDTICTCLTWVSRSRLAAGCANGCVAVWDLVDAVKSISQSPRPMVYSAISTSYLTSVTTCYPSRPNLLLATAMSGFVSMSDLSRSAQSLGSPASTVTGKRTRTGLSHVIWHDYSQTGLHVDETYMLRGTSIRRWFVTMGLARYKSNATGLAVSSCHPFVLVGTASGEVVSTNPTQRVVDGRAAIWQQTWFAHEWRQPTTSGAEQLPHDGPVADGHNTIESEHTSRSPASNMAGSIALSRISQGFRAERVGLTREDRAAKLPDGTVVATIYEEKSAITALAWNPNLHAGGWAAAGMADGLLRVEDIAT